MRSTVLGTSNSILQGGWVQGLRESGAIEVRNLSAGASASAFVLWQILDAGLADPAGEEMFLIDTVVNDETFITARRYDAGWWRVYQDLLIRALPPGRTIFAGFSSRRHFAMASPVAVLQESMVRAAGMRFLSLRRILLAAMRVAKTQGATLTLDDIFEDPGHFHRHLAKMFGRWLAEELVPLDNAPAMPAAALRAQGYDTVLPAVHDGLPERRATSLRSQDTLGFAIGQAFRIDGPRILHGICVDASNTRCILDITPDDGSAGVSIELGYNADSPRMQVKFVHFPQPVAVGPAGCTLAVRDTPAHPLTPGIHSRPEDGPFTGLRLLSFLSGPPVAEPPPAPADPDMSDANLRTEEEKRCARRSGMIAALIAPPDLPKYPRSFIEL